MGDRSETTPANEQFRTYNSPLPPRYTILPPAPLGAAPLPSIRNDNLPRIAIANCLNSPNESDRMPKTTPAFGTIINNISQNGPIGAGTFSDTQELSTKPTFEGPSHIAYNYVRGSSRPPKESNPFKRKATLPPPAPTITPDSYLSWSDINEPPNSQVPSLTHNHLAHTTSTPVIAKTTSTTELGASQPVLMQGQMYEPHAVVLGSIVSDDKLFFATLASITSTEAVQVTGHVHDRVATIQGELESNQHGNHRDKCITLVTTSHQATIDDSMEPLFGPLPAPERSLFYGSVLAKIFDAKTNHEGLAPARVSRTDLKITIEESFPPQPPQVPSGSKKPTYIKHTSVAPDAIISELDTKLPKDFIPKRPKAGTVWDKLKNACINLKANVRTSINNTLAKVPDTLSKVSKSLSGHLTKIYKKIEQTATWTGNLLDVEPRKDYAFSAAKTLGLFLLLGTGLAINRSTIERPNVLPELQASRVSRRTTIPMTRQTHTALSRSTLATPTNPTKTVSVRVDGGTADSAVRYASHALGIPPTRPLIHQATEACAGTTGPTLLTISLDGGVNTPRVACRPRSQHQPVIASQGQQKRKG